MTLYGAIVFIHVATILLFFMAHGVSMFVAFRLRMERDPARVRMLLDLSSWSMGVPAIAAISVGILAGIATGIMGGWLGTLWFWISLVLLVVVGLAMTPMAANQLKPIRAAAGTVAINPFSREQAPAPDSDPAELARLLDGWNPVPIATLGTVTFLVILWLMLFKPF
jgi:uncharacterized membrane protein